MESALSVDPPLERGGVYSQPACFRQPVCKRDDGHREDQPQEQQEKQQPSSIEDDAKWKGSASHEREERKVGNTNELVTTKINQDRNIKIQSKRRRKGMAGGPHVQQQTRKRISR